MRLAYQYWKITGDTDTFDAQWRDAMHLAIATFREQQRENGDGPYHFKRGIRDGGPDGFGPPIKPTGMICTAFRNSDDRATYQFNIPDNLFASSSLRHLAEMADALMLGDKLAGDARSLADQVDAGIKAFGIVDDPKFGKLYAYECDGLGHTLLMDDAGIPSLLAIPYLDPTLAGDPVVLASRRFSLSPADPWFIQGSVAEGVGSVHKGKNSIWPLAIISQAITSTDDAEITKCLAMLTRSSAGTGFMHESFQKNDASKFSRKWFAWVNNFYGELILKILKERPQVLSKPIPADLSTTHFIKLRLTNAAGQLVSENFYWRGTTHLDYTALSNLKPVKLSIVSKTAAATTPGMVAMAADITNPTDSGTVAFALRPKLVKAGTGDQVLPVYMNDGYFGLVPGETKHITFEFNPTDAGSAAPQLVVECWNNFKATLPPAPGR
jgi:hypothetical protein